MNLNPVLDAVMAKVAQITKPIAITWRHPHRTPAKPLEATPRKSWPEWKPADATNVVKKNQRNWFYGEVVFPGSLCGINLKGKQAMLEIHGWVPFSLWLDGEELYEECHAWMATGPIADPMPVPIQQGERHRFVLCVEPTELPAGFDPVRITLRARPCIEQAVALTAAVFQLRLAVALARTDKQRELVQKAAEQIDLDALQSNKWRNVNASLEEVDEVLRPFSERARELTLHLIGHSHIDMDWMWTWPDTVHCIRKDFKATTDLMEDHPEVTFTHSQIPTYQVVQEADPEVFAKVRERIKEGRWENAAGTWVEGDLNMAHGESIARHMLYAGDWTQENLDSKAKVLWEPDTFGHPGNMPQLAALGEFDCYFHWRCNPGRQDNWPVRIWEGVDGTPVVAFSTAYGSGLQPEQVIGNVLQSVKFGFKNILHIWGMGDHGGGISRFNIGLLDLWRGKPVVPTIRFSTIRELLAAVKEEEPDLPQNRGETWSLFEGCFTTHAGIKMFNRRCEEALLAAETMCALANVDKNTELREAWTRVLFNHFHDILDGAAVHDAYINAFERAELSLKDAEQATEQAVRKLVKPAAGGRFLNVFNSLGMARSGPVLFKLPKTTACLIDGEGKPVPMQQYGEETLLIAEDVPAFSYRTYELSNKKPEGLDETPVAVGEEAGFFRIETSSYVCRLNKENGTIGSLVPKDSLRELVPYGIPKHLTHVPTTRSDLAMNVLQVIDEAPNPMSAWLINDNLREENLLRGAKVTLMETGPVFAHFHVEQEFRSSRLEQEILFYRNFPRIDFTTTIDWRECGGPDVGVPELKVSFAASLRAARARFEGPFFVTERAADGLEQPTQKWLDVTGDEAGITVYNDSKYGCDVLGGRMRLTLLRNSYGPDPESDNGVHVVRWGLQPHAPDMPVNRIVRGGMSFNRPFIAMRAKTAPPVLGPGLRIEGAESVVCTALRNAEHSDKLLLRLFETEGRECTAEIAMLKSIASAEEVNFLENPTGGKVRLKSGAAQVGFRPYEVKTLLIETKA